MAVKQQLLEGGCCQGPGAGPGGDPAGARGGLKDKI